MWSETQTQAAVVRRLIQDSKGEFGLQVRVKLYFWLADGSSPLRRDVFDLCHELRMPDRVHGTVADFCASRIFAEIVIPVPIMGRTHGPGCEAAATIRANVLE